MPIGASSALPAYDWKVTELADLLTLRELQTFFWHVLTDVIDDSEVQIRKAWPKIGSPNWNYNDNVMFIQVHEEGGHDITQPIDSIVEDDGEDYLETRYSTRVVRLNLVAYGPKSYECLRKIRMLLYGYNETLHKNKIYVIPEPDTLKSVPELFQGQWWLRADIDIRFNTIIAISHQTKTYRYFLVNTEYQKDGVTEREITEIEQERT